VWTSENRGRYERSRLRYPSDLTDEEWALVEPLSVASIRNSLNDARSQLPADRPGAVFVCIPPAWIEDASLRSALRGTAEAFLRGTGRVVSVKFYVFLVSVEAEGISHRHAYLEIDNPTNRFAPARCWDVFSDHPIPASWNGMPQRILLFPKSEP